MFQHKLHNIVIHESTSMSLSLQFSSQHTFLFSFKNARMSNDLHIRLITSSCGNKATYGENSFYKRL